MKTGLTRLISLVLGIVIVGGAVYWVVFVNLKPKQKAEEPLPVRPVLTMVVGEAMAQSGRSYPGKVQATQRVNLAFRVSGPLIQLPVKEAQEVKTGEILARIDPRDFKTHVDKMQGQLSEAKANLKAMKAGARAEDVEVLKASVDATKAELKKVEGIHKRSKQLYDKGFVAICVLDRDRAAWDVAKANVRTAEEELKKGKAGARAEDIEAMNAKLVGLKASLKDAQSALADTTLKAPFAGRIAKKFVENFQEVKAKEPILSLQDISSVEVVANFPEKRMAMTKGTEGQYRFTAVFDYLPKREFKVEVFEAATEADPATQTYAVTFAMVAPEDVYILSGMTATIKEYRVVKSGPGEHDHELPLNVVPVDGQGQYYVWVVKPEKDDVFTVHRVNVEVGTMAQDSVLVKEGIKKGDRVVTAGVHMLRESQRVRLLAPKTEKAK